MSAKSVKPLLIPVTGFLLLVLAGWDTAVYWLHWNPTIYDQGEFMLVTSMLVIFFYVILSAAFLFGWLKWAHE